jgi:small subunit ribosomal protein S3Ae
MTLGGNLKKYKDKRNKKNDKDSITHKDWFNVKVPCFFTNRRIGKTLAARTTGTKTSTDALKGRIFEVSLADLQQDEDKDSRKLRLRVEDVKESEHACFTNFWGMDLKRDKIRSLVKKWQTTIEANVDVGVTDGYKLRIFVIGFTRKGSDRKDSKRTCYAKSSQIRQIRKRMIDVVIKEVDKCDLQNLVSKLISEVIGKNIKKSCSGIYPLRECMVRKVKMLGNPVCDKLKLMSLYENTNCSKIDTVLEPSI